METGNYLRVCTPDESEFKLDGNGEINTGKQ